MHEIKDAITPENENLTISIEAHQSKRTLCPRRRYVCKYKNLLTLFSESVLMVGGLCSHTKHKSNASPN